MAGALCRRLFPHFHVLGGGVSRQRAILTFSIRLHLYVSRAGSTRWEGISHCAVALLSVNTQVQSVDAEEFLV